MPFTQNRGVPLNIQTVQYLALWIGEHSIYNFPSTSSCDAKGRYKARMIENFDWKMRHAVTHITFFRRKTGVPIINCRTVKYIIHIAGI